MEGYAQMLGMIRIFNSNVRVLPYICGGKIEVIVFVIKFCPVLYDFCQEMVLEVEQCRILLFQIASEQYFSSVLL